MRNNTLVMLGTSAAFGIFAVILARGWVNSAVEREFRAVPLPVANAVSAPRSATQPVVVAAHDLAFGDTLSPESFTVVDYPEGSAPLDAYGSIFELFSSEAGTETPRRALAEMRAMEPILPHRISGPGARASLSARIRDGYVATTVTVDPVTGVGGHVVPGDLVDVILVCQPDADDKPDLYTADIVLQAVRVLGVDQNAALTSEDAALARTITLETDRRDSKVLVLAEERGTIRLVLRGAGEEDYVESLSMSSDRLVRAASTSMAKPKRVRRAPKRDDGRTNVKIVRGDEVQSVRVRRKPATQSADAGAAAAQSPTQTPVLAGGQ